MQSPAADAARYKRGLEESLRTLNGDKEKNKLQVHFESF